MWQAVSSPQCITVRCVSHPHGTANRICAGEPRLTSLSPPLATRSSTAINKQALSWPPFWSTVLPPALCQRQALLLQTLRGSCWAPQQPPPTLQGAAEPLCAQLSVPTQRGDSFCLPQLVSTEPRSSILFFQPCFSKIFTEKGDFLLLILYRRRLKCKEIK